MYVNICCGIDRHKLSYHIDNFVKEHGYGPYLFASLDTLNELDSNLLNYQTTLKSSTGIISTYYGYKTFVDPSKKYGEVELR